MLLNVRWLAAVACCCLAARAFAGAQQYEPLAASVQSAMHAAISLGSSSPRFPSERARIAWLDGHGKRLERRIPSATERREFLSAVYYEAQRAGLEPHLVLGLIQVESAFNRYAVSSAGARGYMQVMPFWTKLLADGDAATLFQMKVNLRYGCTILRHYIDIEGGNLFRALGRYNGSLGKPDYPNAVHAAWKQWQEAFDGREP